MIFHKEELRGLDSTGRACEVCNLHMHDHEWANLDMNGFVTDCNFHYCPCSDDEQIPVMKPSVGIWCDNCDREILFDPSEEVAYGWTVGESGRIE